MCDTCGCNDTGNNVRITKPGEEHLPSEHYHSHGDYGHSHASDDFQHEHTHDSHHEHHVPGEGYSSGNRRILNIEQDILGRNNLIAERNRGYFEARKISALNLMSSPGSGKTTLLEKTIMHLSEKRSLYVIEGDQQTMNDSNRIESAGAPVIQVNTGNGCHLDAEMINKAVKKLDVSENSILLIENVGNLVCPSLFNLGESKRIVIISVTEGEDKPAKYPTMFENADLCIISKIDLLPYVDFNMEKSKEYARRINKHIVFIELSAKTEEGFDRWLKWLSELE